jgi:hypothetical protein
MNQASAKLLLAVLFSASMVSLLNIICSAWLVCLRTAYACLCFEMHCTDCPAQHNAECTSATPRSRASRCDSEHAHLPDVAAEIGPHVHGVLQQLGDALVGVAGRQHCSRQDCAHIHAHVVGPAEQRSQVMTSQSMDASSKKTGQKSMESFQVQLYKYCTSCLAGR